MSVDRKEPSAEGLAIALADSLMPGEHGKPIITERFGATDGTRAGFIVDSDPPGERYRVTVEDIAAKGAVNASRLPQETTKGRLL